MSTWCLDDTHLISDLGSTDLQKSTLSTLFAVPYHPAEQGIAEEHEDIQSILKAHGVVNDSALSFDYVVVGSWSRRVRH